MIYSFWFRRTKTEHWLLLCVLNDRSFYFGNDKSFLRNSAWSSDKSLRLWNSISFQNQNSERFTDTYSFYFHFRSAEFRKWHSTNLKTDNSAFDIFLAGEVWSPPDSPGGELNLYFSKKGIGQEFPKLMRQFCVLLWEEIMTNILPFCIGSYRVNIVKIVVILTKLNLFFAFRLFRFPTLPYPK